MHLPEAFLSPFMYSQGNYFAYRPHSGPTKGPTANFAKKTSTTWGGLLFRSIRLLLLSFFLDKIFCFFLLS